jgi:hypothetical protein
MATTRVKVSREKLIEAVKARRAEAVTQYEVGVQSYGTEVQGRKTAILNALQAAMAQVKKDKLEVSISTRWGSGVQAESISVPYDGPNPQKPVKPNTDKYDHDIAVLEMGTEDSISLSADDYARYIR